jgi:hypothetical protein
MFAFAAIDTTPCLSHTLGVKHRPASMEDTAAYLYEVGAPFFSRPGDADAAGNSVLCIYPHRANANTHHTP